MIILQPIFINAALYFYLQKNNTQPHPNKTLFFLYYFFLLEVLFVRQKNRQTHINQPENGNTLY